MDQVLVGFGDVDEDAGQKLERVDEGFVVLSGLGLVEEELGVAVIAKAGEVHRGPHQIAGQLVQTLGVGGIDGGSVVNAKPRIPPGQEQVDALLGDEVAVSEKSQNLVPEDELGLIGVDVGDGMPRAVREEDAAGARHAPRPWIRRRHRSAETPRPSLATSSDRGLRTLAVLLWGAGSS